jgi:antitoxin component YwqK of YwqJK toxin-antitoxin module/V8-like Glu-specific endopeptidase
MKKLLILLFLIPLVFFGQKKSDTENSKIEDDLELRYEFLDVGMKIVNLRKINKISKAEREKIYNYREWYVQGNKIIGEIKNYYADGKVPIWNKVKIKYDVPNSSRRYTLSFTRPRKGLLRSTYMPCENSTDENCINGTLKKYHTNGKIFYEYEYINNIKVDGVYKRFSPNGDLLDRATVENGEFNGKMERYFLEYSIVAFLKDGKLEGEYKVFDRDGNLTRMENYKNGKLLKSKNFNKQGNELFDFRKVITENRVREYYDNSKNLSKLEGIYKVNGSKIYNPGQNNSWSPNWNVALLLGIDGKKLYGYQLTCYCLSTSKVENGEIRLLLEPTTIDDFYNLTWVNDNKSQYSELVESKANGGLITFNNHTMIKTYPSINNNKKKVKTGEWAGNGSGIIISKSGHIITNHHVIEDADDIEVEFILNDEVQKFNAEIVQVDKVNDLAIIKIFDMNFDGVDELPYNFKTRSSDVGTKVYAFGYPMALSIMGKEIKVTDGMISSKTGFDGNITTYQITAPIQGGNSGGPLFDEKGNLIGINSSGIRKDIADNVAYSIKTSYILNLIDILPKSIELPSNTKLESLPLTEQIKEISKYVVLIKVK